MLRTSRGREAPLRLRWLREASRNGDGGHVPAVSPLPISQEQSPAAGRDGSARPGPWQETRECLCSNPRTGGRRGARHWTARAEWTGQAVQAGRQPLMQQLHPPRSCPHPMHNLNPLPPHLGSALPGRRCCQGPARAARKPLVKANGPMLSKASSSQRAAHPEDSPSPRYPSFPLPPATGQPFLGTVLAVEY